jgi:hypothetical protein
MKKQPNKGTDGNEAQSQKRRVSKKEQILSLYTSGIDNLDDIALMTGSRATYVASVLQTAGLLTGYFDLYTTTSHPMNSYSRFFVNKLGFKDVETAKRSVGVIDRLHRQFEIAGDRAGQHHALLMGLTMYNRARWTNKQEEAEIFRQWLLTRLNEIDHEPTPDADLDPYPESFLENEAIDVDLPRKEEAPSQPGGNPS